MNYRKNGDISSISWNYTRFVVKVREVKNHCITIFQIKIPTNGETNEFYFPYSVSIDCFHEYKSR
jgi:hypothetical protein